MYCLWPLWYMNCLWPLPRVQLVLIVHFSTCTVCGHPTMSNYSLPCTTINSRSSSSSLLAITATSYYKNSRSSSSSLYLSGSVEHQRHMYCTLFVCTTLVLLLFMCPTFVLFVCRSSTFVLFVCSTLVLFVVL